MAQQQMRDDPRDPAPHSPTRRRVRRSQSDSAGPPLHPPPAQRQYVAPLTYSLADPFPPASRSHYYQSRAPSPRPFRRDYSDGNFKPAPPPGPPPGPPPVHGTGGGHSSPPPPAHRASGGYQHDARMFTSPLQRSAAIQLLQNYNYNGRGRTVWRYRYLSNRWIREVGDHAHTREMQVSIADEGFDRFNSFHWRGDDHDDYHDRPGGGPPRSGGPGPSGRYFDPSPPPFPPRRGSYYGGYYDSDDDHDDYHDRPGGGPPRSGGPGPSSQYFDRSRSFFPPRRDSYDDRDNYLYRPSGGPPRSGGPGPGSRYFDRPRSFFPTRRDSYDDHNDYVYRGSGGVDSRREPRPEVPRSRRRSRSQPATSFRPTSDRPMDSVRPYQHQMPVPSSELVPHRIARWDGAPGDREELYRERELLRARAELERLRREEDEVRLFRNERPFARQSRDQTRDRPSNEMGPSSVMRSSVPAGERSGGGEPLEERQTGDVSRIIKGIRGGRPPDDPYSWPRLRGGAGRRRSNSPPRGRKPRPVTSKIDAWFFMFHRGQVVLSDEARPIDTNWYNQQLASALRHEYQRLHYGWLFQPYTWIRDIGMVYVLVWSHRPHSHGQRETFTLLNKMELIERPPEKSNFSASDFRHTFDQLPGRKFADCINTAYTAGVNTRDFGRRDTDRILLMLEFVDLPRASLLATVALFTVPVSFITGLVYGLVQSDLANAIALGSYVASACSLFFAILAAGSWVGLEAPHVFSPTDELIAGDYLQGRAARAMFGPI